MEHGQERIRQLAAQFQKCQKMLALFQLANDLIADAANQEITEENEI